MCSTEDATAGDHPIMPPRLGCVKSSSRPPTRRTVVEASVAERVRRDLLHDGKATAGAAMPIEIDVASRSSTWLNPPRALPRSLP